MTLLERLAGDIKSAMLAKDPERLSTLRMLKSAIGYFQIETGKDDLTDAEVSSVVRKEVKKRVDAAEQFEKAGRAELAEKERRETALLESYLPAALTAAELEALVQEAIRETGATQRGQMGAVIKAVQAKAGGRADGKAISALVGRLLS